MSLDLYNTYIYICIKNALRPNPWPFFSQFLTSHYLRKTDAMKWAIQYKWNTYGFYLHSLIVFTFLFMYSMFIMAVIDITERLNHPDRNIRRGQCNSSLPFGLSLISWPPLKISTDGALPSPYGQASRGR